MIYRDASGDLIGWTDERQALPSASEMWRNSECHGNRILIASLRAKGFIGNETSSYDAALGERIHAELAGEPAGLDRPAQEIRDDCDRLATLAATSFFGNPPDKLHRILYEQRFWYHIGETPFFSGKPDRIYINSSRVLDVNFKTGRSDLDDAHRNLQLRTEVVLLKHCYPEVREIGVAIIQPLVTQTPEIAVYDSQACHKALIEILEIVDATAWDEKRTAGPWCKYCPARAFCSEARALAQAHPITVNVDGLPSGLAASEMLERVYTAEHILKALKKAFKAKVQAEPDSVPGWWIGKGKKIRYVKDWFAAAKLTGDYDTFNSVLNLPIEKLEQWAAAHEEDCNTFFASVIGTKQTAGSLERIPKRLRDK